MLGDPFEAVDSLPTSIDGEAEAVALNTYQPYPYGPLPYGQVNPLVPYPQYAASPLTPYGIEQPAFTKVEISADVDSPVTVTVPQQPDWVNFPAVALDPDGAPFGSTPNTAEALKDYQSSVVPGWTFVPEVNYTFTRSFPIMPAAPQPNVDLFTGTGPSGEAPYHIVGSMLGERPLQGELRQTVLEGGGPVASAMKQHRLQQLFRRSHRSSTHRGRAGASLY